MGIFERLRTTKAKERLAALSTRFSQLPFRTKVIAGAVALGLVLLLILVLLLGSVAPLGRLTPKR